MKFLPLVLLCCLAFADPATRPAAVVIDRSPVPTVGTEGRLDVLLPDGDLGPAPADAKADVIVRIADVRPWGTGFRYDLRYVTAVPGDFDLSKELRRPDGGVPDNLAALPVSATGLLSESHDGSLAGLPGSGGWRLPWYGWLLGAAVLAWVLLLIPLIFVGKRREKEAQAALESPPPTLAQRLRPLVEAAAAGRLDADGRGRLERLLLHVWRGRLAAVDTPPVALVRRLRSHPEAGPLFVALEDWLHRPPGSPRPSDAELAMLLGPYKYIPDRDLNLEVASSPNFSRLAVPLAGRVRFGAASPDAPRERDG